jgi:hypothetical protein
MASMAESIDVAMVTTTGTHGLIIFSLLSL